MAQRKLRMTMTPSELLFANADGMEFLTSTFKGIDLALEAHKCCAWWNAKGGFVNPKLAFLQWLEAGVRRRVNGRGDTPEDRNEYLRDYERRRGQTA